MLQNDFHVPLMEVPQIITKSKYPPRDPNLKDNWRGRARQDLSNMDDQIIQVITEINGRTDFCKICLTLSLLYSQWDNTNLLTCAVDRADQLP